MKTVVLYWERGMPESEHSAALLIEAGIAHVAIPCIGLPQPHMRVGRQWFTGSGEIQQFTQQHADGRVSRLPVIEG